MKDFVKKLCKYYLIKLNSRKQIFMLGDGRSGTTWITEVLNFDRKYLDLFEPFHGKRILELTNDRLYPTGSDLDKLDCRAYKLEDYARKTKSFVRLENQRRIALSGIIIKDISSTPKVSIIELKNITSRWSRTQVNAIGYD